jgi:hypothetical protein
LLLTTKSCPSDAAVARNPPKSTEIATKLANNRCDWDMIETRYIQEGSDGTARWAAENTQIGGSV